MCYLSGTYLRVGLLGAHYKIRDHITCTTSNIIYLISCRICGIQYISETKNSLKKRFYGHRSTVKTHKLNTPVGQHFNLHNHSTSDMILQGIEALANRRESVRLSREKMWIRRVHTIMWIRRVLTITPWSQHTGRKWLISPFFSFFPFSYIGSTFVLHVSLFVGFVLHRPPFWLIAFH